MHNNTAFLASVTLTYGCGAPDSIVDAYEGATLDRCVAPCTIDRVRDNRFVAGSLEGVATLTVRTKRGLEWCEVRVEKCSDGCWHAAGKAV